MANIISAVINEMRKNNQFGYSGICVTELLTVCHIKMEILYNRGTGHCGGFISSLST